MVLQNVTYIQGPLVRQGLVRTAQGLLVCSTGRDGSPDDQSHHVITTDQSHLKTLMLNSDILHAELQ